MLSQILENWEDIKAKKTLDDTHFKLKKVFTKSHFKSFNQFKQVLVKNIGNCSKQRLENALRYTIENADSKAIDQNGNEVELNEILDDWRKDFSSRENSKEGWHLVFSINEEVNAKNMKTLEKAVKDTMEKNFFEYKYVLVKHTHQNNPHIHVIVNKNNIFTKKKMHFKTNAEFKEFFNTVRDDFAMALNFYDPKLKYQNLSAHNRDLELQKMKESNIENLDLKLSVEKRIHKLETESIINFNRIEKNREKIKDLRKEQRHILSLFKKDNEINEVISIQKTIDKLEKDNEKLRSQNQSINRFVRDFKEMRQMDFHSPLVKKKAVEFLKKNPKMLTLKQIVNLPKIEKMIDSQMKDIQNFHQQKIQQDIKHSGSLGTFQKTGKMLRAIKECQDNMKNFPEHKALFQKNINVLENFLDKKKEYIEAKIANFGKVVEFKEILEKENQRIETYLKNAKREEIIKNVSSKDKDKDRRKIDDLFKAIENLKNQMSNGEKNHDLDRLEKALAQKFCSNQQSILILEKSIKSKIFLEQEQEAIENYFNSKVHAYQAQKISTQENER